MARKLCRRGVALLETLAILTALEQRSERSRHRRRAATPTPTGTTQPASSPPPAAAAAAAPPDAVSDDDAPTSGVEGADAAFQSVLALSGDLAHAMLGPAIMMKVNPAIMMKVNRAIMMKVNPALRKFLGRSPPPPGGEAPSNVYLVMPVYSP